MLQGEHSAILLTFIKLPFVIKIFVMSIFEWPFYTSFTVEGFKLLEDTCCTMASWQLSKPVILRFKGNGTDGRVTHDKCN